MSGGFDLFSPLGTFAGLPDRTLTNAKLLRFNNTRKDLSESRLFGPALLRGKRHPLIDRTQPTAAVDALFTLEGEDITSDTSRDLDLILGEQANLQVDVLSGKLKGSLA